MRLRIRRCISISTSKARCTKRCWRCWRRDPLPGSAADLTFVHTLEALAQAGAGFDAIDLGQLAYSGMLRSH
jgi:lactate dehydrogenase-like 2-hydroxyacid dehydrogenase